MAEQIIEKINKCLGEGKSFIMMGGAGSGKTHTLMLAIDSAVKKFGAGKVGCVTYTNAAVNEIKRRCPYENLRVGTIHDSLWDLLAPFQKNLVAVFRELINSNAITVSDEDKKAKALAVEEVQYREFRALDKGVFSHDDLLKIAQKMLEKYPMLLKFFADKNKCFFIDEYQDSFNVLIDLCAKASASHGTIVGLFGDSMQEIYGNYKDGHIEEKVITVGFVRIDKADNYRCSKQIIGLINKVRTDGIKQEPAAKNLEGSIKFIYSTSNKTLAQIKANAVFAGWSAETTKELLLTHRLVSRELGFENYLDAFSHFGMNSNSMAIGKKDTERHKVANYLFKMAELVDAYQRKDYNFILAKIDKPIKKATDKKLIADTLIGIIQDLNQPCLEKIDELVNVGILRLSNVTIASDKEKDNELLEKLDKIPFREVLAAYRYAENMTPFSTQHNVKGLEYENVFVYLDNAGWNQYNFKKLFSNDTTNQNLYTKTLNLLYVCLSRAKNNLVVYFPNPDAKVLAKAKEWFGDSNTIEII